MFNVVLGPLLSSLKVKSIKKTFEHTLEGKGKGVRSNKERRGHGRDEEEWKMTQCR